MLAYLSSENYTNFRQAILVNDHIKCRHIIVGEYTQYAGYYHGKKFGAIIGAMSVVTKNIGPYEIWAGSPAKLLKKRFSDEDIQKLVEIKWWDWDFDKIKKNLNNLRSPDIRALWKKYKNGEL